MPTVPAVIAGSMSRWMGRAASVTAVSDLSPGLRRVSFAGAALRDRPWKPGCEVEFRVSERDFRHYTPARTDAGTGEIDVVFQLHSDGPGTRWARALAVGDEVTVLGPGGRAWPRPGKDHLLLGDASALGLFEVLIKALADTGRVTGAVELPAEDVPAALRMLPGLTVLPAGDRPGDALLAWVADGVQAPPDAAYVAGHARSIQRLRALLCSPLASRPQMRRRDVVVKPYWADGRTGL